MNQRQNILLTGIFLLCLFLPLQISAQNAEEDFKRINEVYFENKKLSMEVDYNAYANHSTEIVSDHQHGKICIDGENQYQLLGTIEYVKVKDSYIVVNHQLESINLSRFISDQKEGPTSIPDMKILKDICKDIQYKRINNKIALYSMKCVSREFERIDIIYNTQTYLLEKIVFYYLKPSKFSESAKSEKPRIEIIYSKINTSPKFEKGTFDYSKFLSYSNGKYFKKENYKKYEFVNHLYDE